MLFIYLAVLRVALFHFGLAWCLVGGVGVIVSACYLSALG